MVVWLWEVNSIDNSTLNRFFSLQFCISFSYFRFSNLYI
ncbi:MAG: hypothetical protein ACXW1A_00810 [Nitrososphaeraceae archaeon]